MKGQKDLRVSLDHFRAKVKSQINICKKQPSTDNRKDREDKAMSVRVSTIEWLGRVDSVVCLDHQKKDSRLVRVGSGYTRAGLKLKISHSVKISLHELSFGKKKKGEKERRMMKSGWKSSKALRDCQKMNENAWVNDICK